MNNVNDEIVYGICNIVVGDCVRNMLLSYGSWQRRISWNYFSIRVFVQVHSLRKIQNTNATCFSMENYAFLFEFFLLQCIFAMYIAVK